MTHQPLQMLARATLLGALAVTVPPTHAAGGLDATNFVDVGDSLADLLDTSGLAFATMLMDPAALPAPAGRDGGGAPGTPPMPRRQAFDSLCPNGGRVRIDVIDADASGDLSARDRFRLNFAGCVVDGDVLNGRSEFVVAAHRFEGSVEITELDFRFDALGSPAMRWTGAAHATLRSDLRRGTESYAVTYRDLAVTRGAHTMRWNFSVDLVRPPVGAQIASVRGAMTVDGLPLQLHQDEPFAITADGHPHAGQVTATDRLGARLQLEARRRRYAYRFFVAGNAGESPDARSQSRPFDPPSATDR